MLPIIEGDKVIINPEANINNSRERDIANKGISATVVGINYSMPTYAIDIEAVNKRGIIYLEFENGYKVSLNPKNLLKISQPINTEINIFKFYDESFVDNGKNQREINERIIKLQQDHTKLKVDKEYRRKRYVTFLEVLMRQFGHDSVQYAKALEEFITLGFSNDPTLNEEIRILEQLGQKLTRQ